MKRTPEKLSVGFLFDDSLDSNDGVAQYVKTLGAWLSDQGHDVTYLVGETKLQQWHGAKVYSLSRNLKVAFNKNRANIPIYSKKSAISQVMAQQHFDVLHVQVPYSPVMAERVIMTAESSTAIVGTFHVLPAGNLASIGTRTLGYWSRRSLRRFDSFISNSQPTASFAKKTFGIDSQIIPNMVDVSRFLKPKKSEFNKNRVIFLGRLVKRKGCLQLLKAFKILHKSLPKVELVIAGDGPERAKLQAWVRNNNLTDNVKFLGFIDEKDKPSLLASAQLVCLPSLYGESFGIVLIEAMAASSGVVLAGNNVAYASILGQQPLMLIDPTNTKAFADRLRLILSDANQCEQLHKWLKQTVGQYDVHVVGEQILDVYRSAIAKKAKKIHNRGHAA